MSKSFSCDSSLFSDSSQQLLDSEESSSDDDEFSLLFTLDPVSAGVTLSVPVTSPFRGEGEFIEKSC